MRKRIISSVILSSLLLVVTSFLVMLSPANAMEDHAIPVAMERLDSVLAQVGNYNGKYAGQFTNQSLNTSGSVVLNINIASSAVSGYINFTNNPGGGPLCGAGNFNGTRSGDTIQFSFTSSDSDPGCTWANGLVINVSGVLSGNQIVNGIYTVSDGEKGVFSATQTTPYTGRFTTLKNRVGSVSIDLASSATMVAGFINFTNDPGTAALCGAGSFVGTRNVNAIQFSFLSNDPDAGCTFDKGLVFNINGTVSGNQLSGSYAIPSISEGGSLLATAPLVDTTAPIAPGNPVATSILQTSVAMNWADNSNNEDGFKVYRYDVTVQDWVVASTVSANVTSYTITGLSCNTQYYFNVNAYNAYGEVPAPASGWLIVTTGACDPPPPSLYAVSGRIIDGSGNALTGVTVSDGTRSAMTDTNGNYTISNIPVGNYTLTPSISGYTFNPTNHSVSISGNVTGQDFVGTSTVVASTWTFLLYMDGEDPNLDSWLQGAITSMEALPANANLKILVLFDGPQNGDTRRLVIQPGGNYTNNVNKWALGERNFGDPQTLQEFIDWGQRTYPADNYYLAVADHGNGNLGISWDRTNNDDYLTTTELGSAIAVGTNNGQRKIDVLHYDACLMGLLENAYQVKDYADYLIFSQNLGWGIFSYGAYVNDLGVQSIHPHIANLAAGITATTTPQQFAKAVAATYFNGLASNGYPRTISVLDMNQIDPLQQAVDGLAKVLSANMSSIAGTVQNTRNTTQMFDSRGNFRIETDDDYADLYDFAARIKQNVSISSVQTAAQAVMSAVNLAVIAEYHLSGSIYNEPNSYYGLDNAHGVSIYFPSRSGSRAYTNYIAHQNFSFTTVNSWDNFLKDYFGLTALAPETGDGLMPVALLDAPQNHKVFIPLLIR